MSISRQTGWGPEENLLYDILKQVERLTEVISQKFKKNKQCHIS